MNSRWAIALGFLGTILLGAFLLTLPITVPAQTWRPWGEALFTACSAVCITGLSVIDIGTAMTPCGQAILMGLVELGCVGIMTVATFFLVVVGRRLSLSSEFSLVSAYGTHGVKGLRGLVIWVILATLFFQAVGTVLLWLQFTADAPNLDVAWADKGAWFQAAFYAVMSFANAGFSLAPESLASFQQAPGVLLVLACEVIIGGLGFFVIYNVCTIRFWRRNLVTRGRLSLHSRIVLFATFVLLSVTFAAFLAGEYHHALAHLKPLDKIAVAFFQAVSPRSCGYTVVPVENAYDVTRFVNGILMFIGAAPGGAGGGVKITTIVVFLLTIGAIYHGRFETVVCKRTVPIDVVRESFVIFFFAVALIVTAMVVLLISESSNSYLTFERLFFETISAVTTTGLSCGDTTAHLSPIGRAVIMVCMFFGRLGAITVVMLIGGHEEHVTVIRYPKEELVVG